MIVVIAFFDTVHPISQLAQDHRHNQVTIRRHISILHIVKTKQPRFIKFYIITP